MLVLVYLAAAWPLVIDPKQDGGFPQDLITGVLVALVLLSAIAAVSFGVARWRRRKHPDRAVGRAGRSFRGALTTVPVLLIAFVLAAMSAAGRQLDQTQQRANLAVSDANSSNPINRDRGALGAWMTALPTGQQDKAQALHELALMLKALQSPNPNLHDLISKAQTANNAAGTFIADVNSEPAATADVQAIKGLHLQEATLFKQATSDYLRGLKTGSRKLLNAGDAAMQQSDGYARRTAKTGEALYAKLGGPQAFRGRVDFQAMYQQVLQAKQTAKP